MRKHFLFTVIALLAATVAYAYDFTAVCSSGQTLAYRIVDAGARTCEVTTPDEFPKGEVTIDATVVNPDDSQTYTVIGIGTYAFYRASEVTGVTFPTAATFTYIGKAVYYEHCFRVSGLKGKLVIPDNVTQIGGTAFYDTDITEVQIGSGVTQIGPSAFYDCEYLTHVELPNAVTYIGSTSFASCSKLAYFQFGTGITNVVGDALYYNYKLDTIVVKATTPPAVSMDMQNTLTSSALLYVPSASVSAYKAHARWGQFKYIYAEGTPVTRYTLALNNATSGGVNDNCRVKFNGSYLSNGQSIKLVADEECHVVLQPQRFWVAETITLNGVDIKSKFVNNEAVITLTEDATLKVTWYQPEKPYDFAESVPSGQLLYFTITDAVNHKAKVVNQSGVRGNTGLGYVERQSDGTWVQSDNCPKGDLILPATIKHEGVTYAIEEIDTLAFSEADLTSVTFSEGLKAIRHSAFYYNSNLGGSVFIPQSCTIAEGWIFRDTKITEISTGGVETLTEYMTLYSRVKHIKSTSATKYIQSYFQSSSSYLETIEIGENVERVSNYAIYSCTYVKKVICYATTPPAIKSRADQVSEDTYWGYFPVAGMTLYVPKGTKAAYEAANCWKLFGTIEEMKDTYTISAEVSGTGLGNVSGAGRYEEGTDTILTAVPAPHYKFVKWSDGNTDNPRRITVTGNKTYTAEFAPKYTVKGDILEQTDKGVTIRYEVISIAPNEVKLIDNGSYYRGIKGDWTIPANVTDYWGETFSLTRLGQYCLYSTYYIDTLRIPEGVRVVESAALYNSTCFRKWCFPSTIDSIYGTNVTYCNNLKDIEFAGVDNLRYIDFAAISSGETRPPLYYDTPDNSFCIKNGVALFFRGTAPKVLDVPEGVKVISKRVMGYYGISSVQTLRLPSTLKTICDAAFDLLPSSCETVYLKSENPPAATKGILSNEASKKVVVACDANLSAYRAHPYWSTLDTIVAGSQYVLTVERVNNYGSYVVTEPVCGTMHIVAHPDTYYVVDKWSTGETTDSIDIVLTGDTTVTVSFKLESYTVRFLDWDSTEVYPAVSVQRGSNIGSVPVLPNNKTGYTSQSWKRSDGVSDMLGAIWKNVDYVAYYTPNTYTITFKNWNGAVLQSYSRKYDETVYYNAGTPTRLENDTFTYAFKAWDPECTPGVTTVTGDMTFTATYAATYKKYTITFYNHDGSVLHVDTLHYGDVITYDGVTPTKEPTEKYVYVFTGWDNGLVDGQTKVSKSTGYTAQFEQQIRKYKITFVNDDGVTELWSGEFEYESMPVYGGETPVKAADETYEYTFLQWSPELVKVTSDATYKAEYSKTYIDYTVIFSNYDGSELEKQENKHYGDVITYTDTPQREADVQYIYTFAAWDPAFESGVTTVTGNMTFTATYSTELQKYTVTFLKAEGGETLAEVAVEYGSDATAVAPDVTEIAPDGQCFDRWSLDITNVQGDMTVWPLWKEITGLDDIDAEVTAAKFIHDGHFYILRDGKIYNAMGALIK